MDLNKYKKLSDRDRTYLMKIYLDPVAASERIPLSVYQKLIKGGYVKIELTDEGKKAGFITAIQEKLPSSL